MYPPTSITVTPIDGRWAFETPEHGLHVGYPDPWQAFAAGMRAYDPSIPREDVSAAAVHDFIREAVVQDRRASIRLVPDDKGQST